MNIDGHGSHPKGPPPQDANQCNHEAANHRSGSNGAATKNKGQQRTRGTKGGIGDVVPIHSWCVSLYLLKFKVTVELLFIL